MNIFAKGEENVKTRFGIKIGDILLAACVLLAAAYLFIRPLFTEEAENAEIVFAETGETQIIPLDLDKEYDVISRGIEMKVRVKDGSVDVSGSTCRDGICKNTPPISRAGQSIVCAPAGVVVRIAGEEALVDGVSG